MPTLSCPYRTDEVIAGNAQWCETRRGLRTGPYRRWTADGMLLVEGQYAYGHKDGLWTEYYTSGYVYRELEYDKGGRYGRWATWDEDGIEISVVFH